MTVDALAPETLREITMTETVAPEAVTRPKHTDEYNDVIDMFHVLKTLAAESHEYARQRERIINRCLQLADHVARHYDRRGENLEDLIQVARLGLLNAVNRFDPEKSSSFLAFAVPTMMGEV